MTNHPSRSYYSLINKLQHISADGGYSADCRRLAVNSYQRMMAADRCPRQLASDASYRNLHGRNWQRRMEADRAAIEAERASNMEQARQAAERFIAAWSL